jgi:single-strand DNA-binding protein
MALPTIIVEGRLTRDPELRFTQGGVALAKFGIASNDRRKNDQGDWEDGDPCFLDVSCWGKTAENVVDSLAKGDLAIVRGVLKLDTWEAEDGTSRNRHTLNVTNDGYVGVSLRFRSAPHSEQRQKASTPARPKRDEAEDSVPF